jgi:hypothetical protein
MIFELITPKVILANNGIGVFYVYASNLFTADNENTVVLWLKKFPSKHTKLPYIFNLVLKRNHTLYIIKKNLIFPF